MEQAATRRGQVVAAEKLTATSSSSMPRRRNILWAVCSMGRGLSKCVVNDAGTVGDLGRPPTVPLFVQIPSSAVFAIFSYRRHVEQSFCQLRGFNCQRRVKTTVSWFCKPGGRVLAGCGWGWTPISRLSINRCAPRYAAKRRRLGVNGSTSTKKDPKIRSPRVGPVFSGAVSRGCHGGNRQSLWGESGRQGALRRVTRGLWRGRHQPAWR